MLRIPYIMCLVLAGAVAVSGAPSEEWEDCAGCHEELAAHFDGSTHARIRAFETPDGAVGCGACHGDTAHHMDTGDTDRLVRFGEDAEADSRACLNCHARHDGLGAWGVSVHAEELGCTSCHTMHQSKDPHKACAECHYEVEAAFLAPSHHPVYEGKMTCSSCHNVHASTNFALKTDERLNDLCWSCHSAQQGPFIFEHEPVVEDCSTCHNPHGSIANNLLTVNEPQLCLQCHEFHFHAGLQANEEEEQVVGGVTYHNVLGEYGYQRAFTTKCTQCHTQIHGSDLPSQGVTSRGRSMTR